MNTFPDSSHPEAFIQQARHIPPRTNFSTTKKLATQHKYARKLIPQSPLELQDDLLFSKIWLLI